MHAPQIAGCAAHTPVELATRGEWGVCDHNIHLAIGRWYVDTQPVGHDDRRLGAAAVQGEAGAQRGCPGLGHLRGGQGARVLSPHQDCLVSESTSQLQHVLACADGGKLGRTVQRFRECCTVRRDLPVVFRGRRHLLATHTPHEMSTVTHLVQLLSPTL